jgi:hypothetical protein
MILSHKHKFIFIKTNKTAGTSLEIALSEFCGPDDIITPIGRDEEIRKSLGHLGPQNCYAPISAYGAKDYGKRILRGEKKLMFHNHISAQKIKSMIDSEIWNTYFKFCFERNPWDRFISFYYFRNRKEPRPSFLEFLKSDAIYDMKKRCIENYTINGQIAVDRICRLEDMDSELKLLQSRLDLKKPIQLSRAKGSFRPQRKHYRDLLDDESAQFIAEYFREEIETLGYSF